MSGNLPVEIQVEIIKHLPVKSLIQFRSVSKTWKSLIDSSDFIAHYSGQQTQMQHLLVKCFDPAEIDHKYVLFADDYTFPQQKTCLTFPKLLNQLAYYYIIGCSHGLLCLYGHYIKGRGVNKFQKFQRHMVVFWNLSIRKVVAVIVPNMACDELIHTVVGFGVCEATTHPKVVKISRFHPNRDCNVEVFTLGTRAWRTPYSNLPRKSIQFDWKQVDVNGLLFWLATDRITMDDGFRYCKLIVSFDLTSEEFREINLPSSCLAQDSYRLYLSQLRNSLVLLEHDVDNNNSVYIVWVMEDGVTKSFAKLFTIDVNTRPAKVKGFRKSGVPIIENFEDCHGELVVYEPCSKDMDNFSIYGNMNSFAVYPYVETLLLLDQPDHMVYSDV